MKEQQKGFKTTHNLDFYARDYPNAIPDDTDFYTEYKVGTCVGLWTNSNNSYDIVSIINSEPGNGHVQDVIEWFEHSCKRENKDLRFMEMMNDKFERKLIEKFGFIKEPETNNLIKYIRKKWKK